MAKKRKIISEFEYREMQVAYAFQLFREGFTARQVQEKLNIPSSINLAGMAKAAIEGSCDEFVMYKKEKSND